MPLFQKVHLMHRIVLYVEVKQFYVTITTREEDREEGREDFVITMLQRWWYLEGKWKKNEI